MEEDDFKAVNSDAVAPEETPAEGDEFVAVYEEPDVLTRQQINQCIMDI